MRLILSLAVFSITASVAYASGSDKTPRKEILLTAEQLAPPELRSDEPTPGKWWLKRDAKDWGLDGAILMTGKPETGKNKTGEWVVPPQWQFTPQRVPALTIDPKAEGRYHIYVGLYQDTTDQYIRPQLWGKLSGEPYPEYLRPPESSGGKVAECYWRTEELGGKKFFIEQPPAPMPHPGRGWMGGLAYVRLVPTADRTYSDLLKEMRAHRLFGMLDTTDEIFWWGTIEKEDDVRAIIYRHRQAGFGRVYWRAFGSALDHTFNLPEAAPRWSEADEKRWCKAQGCEAGWAAMDAVVKKFDMLKVAVDYGAKHDCEVHAWVRFTNFNREPYCNFWHDHPEFRAQMVAFKTDPKTGKREVIRPYVRTPYPRVLSLAYPEVRAFYVKFFKEIARTGTKGILIDLLRHPPIAGYEPIVADAFKKKYGKDMEEFDVYRDPLCQEHLSSYFKLFLVDLRKEIGKDIEISVRSSGPDGFALRGKEWIDEGLIDTIIDGNWYSGFGPRPTIDKTVEAVGKRGKAFAVAESVDVDPKKGWGRRPGSASAEAIVALSKHYSGKGVARFGLYESTVFTWYPDLRRAVLAAGWDYDPQKK
jgi:hypothetical protein